MRNVWGWAFFAFFDGERPKTNKKGRKKEGKKTVTKQHFVCVSKLVSYFIAAYLVKMIFKLNTSNNPGKDVFYSNAVQIE